ncbi:MAG: hypothetical protein ABIQ16_15610 [Polyangiaceae bacterium]
MEEQDGCTRALLLATVRRPMNTKIESIIQNFVSELTAALQEASHDALSLALGGGSRSVGGGRKKPGPKPRLAIATSDLRALPGGRKRRNADDVQRQLDAVLAFVNKNPLSGAEAIGTALGLSTIELSAPIKLGLSKKVLKRTGKLRGTKYSGK